tara:strand:+ start:5040 stop:5366 length:327 start_codon:yes stop_codon:yes gene_type:complete
MKGKVTMPLWEFENLTEELRLAKEKYDALTTKNVVVSDHFRTNLYFITTDEALIKAGEYNKLLEEDNRKLESKVNTLEFTIKLVVNILAKCNFMDYRQRLQLALEDYK